MLSGHMDELEARINALEIAFIELCADLPADRLTAAMERIREGLPTEDELESASRKHALVLLDDALVRHDGFTGGIVIKKP